MWMGSPTFLPPAPTRKCPPPRDHPPEGREHDATLRRCMCGIWQCVPKRGHAALGRMAVARHLKERAEGEEAATGNWGVTATTS